MGEGVLGFTYAKDYRHRSFDRFRIQKVFGSPGNEIALISLLNALLGLRSPIANIQILNPYNDKDFEEDKLSILDLRAEDERGRIFTIEAGWCR